MSQPKDATPPEEQGTVHPAAFLALKLALRWLGTMSKGRAMTVGVCLMPIFNLITARQRRKNLRTILGTLGWGEARLSEVSRDHAKYFARWLVEMGRLIHQPTAEINQLVPEVTGAGLVREALQEGRGVLVVMSHLGTNMLVPLILSHQGLPLEGVINARSQAGRRYFSEFVRRYGAEALFVRGGAGLGIRRALRKGKVVALANDVCVEESRALWMPLGGGFTPIDTGPAALALAAGCPVIKGESWQLPQSGGRVEFIRSPVYEIGHIDPLELTILWMKEFEKVLLHHPEQWWLWGFSEFATGKTVGQPLLPRNG